VTTDMTMSSAFDPPGIRLGVVRGISYGLFGKPGEFVPQARALGAGLIRAYLYWGQVEPEPGRYQWEVVDALLAQLDGDEEVWVTLCSSSPWGTRVPTDFQPQSPAHDQRAYGEFVRRVVRHCGGRVRYWQCNNEPSNTDLLWAGTAAEYVAQLKTFFRAVRDSDPAAAVVLGGCGYDVFSSEPGSAARQFFDHVASAGRDTFALLAGELAGARAVTRAEAGDRPALHAFEVDRAGRGPLLVLWEDRDAFHGEDEPPVTVTWPWPAETATVTDVFGKARTVRGQDGRIRLPVSGTPLFVADRAGAGRAGSAERRHRRREPAGGKLLDLPG
jgi:hypothetical protein